jgi:hypothetical protein
MSIGSHTVTRRQSTVPLLLTAALCIATASGVRAEERSVQATQGSSAATLEGTWRVEITLLDCQTGAQVGVPFPALATFARGGTLTTADGGMSPTARGAGHGVWWRLQGRTFAAVAENFLFAMNGALIGRQRISQQIELDGHGAEFHAWVSATATNNAGQVLFTGCATSVGRRLD